MSQPIEFPVLVPILKSALKAKGKTYKNLAHELGMSEANIKKMMRSGDCSIKRLNQICQVLDTSLQDLLNAVYASQMRSVSLSEEQQEVLTSDETNLLVYFKSAIEKIPAEQIKKDLKISQAKLFSILRRLEKVKLLELYPEDKIVVDPESIGVWPDEGKLAQLVKTEWGRAVVNRAAKARKGTGHFLTIRFLRLTPEGAKELEQKIAETVSNFARRSAVEEKLADKVGPVSILCGIVPDTPTNIRVSDLHSR